MGTKTCRLCGEEKPYTQFKKNRHSSFGVEGRCKACINSARQTAEQREKKRQINKRWYEKNTIRVRAYWQQWYEKNVRRRKEYCHQYHIKHPEKARNSEYRRRVCIRKAATSYTQSEWEELCARYGYMCLSCRQSKPLEVDHVVPLSKGGSNSIENIQPLCQSCNRRKAVQIIDYR
jgi:5-methylcytosine-specific restriction endonuclease McrA